MDKLNKLQTEKIITLLGDYCFNISENFSFTELERKKLIEENNTIIEILGGEKW